MLITKSGSIFCDSSWLTGVSTRVPRSLVPNLVGGTRGLILVHFRLIGADFR